MSRALIIIRSDDDRLKAASWCRKAPAGCRVEFKLSKRTIPQNDIMWAMLTDISKQADHMGHKYSPDDWKALFLAALGQEMQFLPSLDGKGFIPLGHRSSDLTKQEMTDMIELMLSWGADRGIVFNDAPHT